jgi:hypothetical protein
LDVGDKKLIQNFGDETSWKLGIWKSRKRMERCILGT